MSAAVTYRSATAEDDDAVIAHYLAVWKSYATPDNHFLSDAPERARAFVRESREQNQGGVIIAEADGRIVGSTGYERQTPQFPDAIRTDIRKVGYIWSVWVEPEARRRGIAGNMVAMAVERLGAIGCTMIALHASEAGAPVYVKAGFVPGYEMRLKL